MKRSVVLLVMVVLLCASFASAITGSIGNARMILREIDGRKIEVGDVVERTVLVKNVNNVSVDIGLFASGDLAEDTTIVDDSFTLGVGEEKKALFRITVTEAGTTETNINVKFTPEEGSGVGLTSTVIIIAKDNSFWSDIFGSDDEDDDGGNGNGIDNNGLTGNVALDIDDKPAAGAGVYLIIGMFFVFLILLIVLLLLMIKNKQRGAIKPKKRVKRRRG